MIEKKTVMINTPILEKLVRSASGRKRSVYEEKFLSEVSKEGLHMIVFAMVHNDCEMRLRLICKMNKMVKAFGNEYQKQAEIWLDVSFDAYEEAINYNKRLQNALNTIAEKMA